MAFRLSGDRLYRYYRESFRDHKTRTAVLVTLVVAAATRLVYATWDVTDFWGDAYHHWLISRLTLANDWVYADYKGLETVWLPGYHYLTAAVMAIWGRADLAPTHLANFVLGTLACGLLAWLIAQITQNWLAGLAAGVTLALLPWHIAYSQMNMPEVVAGVLLLSTLLAVRRGRVALLAILAFASALTRHELTLLLVPVAVWLAWRREWRALVGFAAGSGLGILVWSVWSYHIEGDPLYWWTRYRALTAWDARFWAESGVRLADLQTLWKAARTAFPPVIVVGLTTLGGLLFAPWRRRVPREGWLMVALVMLHWSAVGLGFAAGNLPSADPRYVLVSLPIIAGVGVVLIAALPYGRPRWIVATLYALLLVSSLVRQLPDFRGMAYTLAPERAAGEFLGRITPVEGQFWVDAPVAIYFSGLEPGRFRSSDQLLPDTARERNDTAGAALEAVDSHGIEYVLWEDVSYTHVQRVWPQMAQREPFEQNGFHFEPVFQYSGWELDYGARPTVIWRVIRTETDG